MIDVSTGNRYYYLYDGLGSVVALWDICIHRGRPFGDEKWVAKAVKDLLLESSLRPLGRPKKEGKI